LVPISTEILHSCPLGVIFTQHLTNYNRAKSFRRFNGKVGLNNQIDGNDDFSLLEVITDFFIGRYLSTFFNEIHEILQLLWRNCENLVEIGVPNRRKTHSK